VATYVLVPGAMGDPWYWHRVVPLLRARGHDVVTPELPADDDSAGLAAYVDAIDAAIGARGDLVLVAQSMGALSAPLVAARRAVSLLVLVAPMIPRPGESGGDWWANTGQAAAERALAESQGRDPEAAFDPAVTFLHDVSPDVRAEAAARVREQSSRPFADPWPLAAWPDVPTSVIACRGDRLFPLELVRRISRERLGIVPEELDCGHLPALANPDALVALLERLRETA
jgi:pimeloyl-ACP methyl ester carboxylesterase